MIINVELFNPFKEKNEIWWECRIDGYILLCIREKDIPRKLCEMYGKRPTLVGNTRTERSNYVLLNYQF